MRLTNKVAIVTGGATGIGAGIARCLAAEGARIGIIDLDGPEAEAAASGLGVEAVGLAADVSQESEALAATEKIVGHFGRLDILVNNAGGGGPQAMTSVGNPFRNIDQAGWEDAMATNLGTAFAATKAAIPHLKKAGVITLTRTLALELAPCDIRVNEEPALRWVESSGSVQTVS